MKEIKCLKIEIDELKKKFHEDYNSYMLTKYQGFQTPTFLIMQLDYIKSKEVRLCYLMERI